jgi:PUA domain protein
MVPGLTSKGGRLPDEDAEGEDEAFGTVDLEPGAVAVIEAEGKENACMVGQLKMGTKEMKTKKKGVAIDEGHYLGDGLWKLNLE